MGEKEINIKWCELFKPIEGIQVGEGLSNKISIEREVIPLIFPPGIMATPLKNKEGKTVWAPDNAGFMLWNYGVFGAATAKSRKALLIGAAFDKDYLSVIKNDPEHNKLFADQDDTTRAERDWGSASWGSYGVFLAALQQRDYADNVDDLWCEPVRHCFEFPVHVCGYNWTASNRDSGKALAKYIDVHR